MLQIDVTSQRNNMAKQEDKDDKEAQRKTEEDIRRQIRDRK
jgi:hypothetical protein